MAAVFAPFIAIRSEWLTAVGAGVLIDRFPIHAVWVAVPPGSPASVRAELPGFPLGYDFYHLSAVLTGNRVAYYYLLALSRNIASESHGSAMAHVTMEKMNNSFIVFPSYEEQEAIAKNLTREVEMIDSLIAEKEKLLVDLESYKRSLIYETVTGKRKVV